jgi:hypothetical protein
MGSTRIIISAWKTFFHHPPTITEVWFKSLIRKTEYPTSLNYLNRLFFGPLLVSTVVWDDVAVDPTCQSAPTSYFSYSLHHPLPLKAAIGTTSWASTLSSTADGDEGALDMQERGGSATHCGRVCRRGYHALLDVVGPLRCCPLVWLSGRICRRGHRRAPVPR